MHLLMDRSTGRPSQRQPSIVSQPPVKESNHTKPALIFRRAALQRSSTEAVQTRRRLRLTLIAVLALNALAATATNQAEARPLGPCDGPCPEAQPAKPKPKPSPRRGGRVGCDDCNSSARPAKPNLKPSPPRPKWVSSSTTATIGPAYFLGSRNTGEYGPCARGLGKYVGEVSIIPRKYQIVSTGHFL